MKSLLNSAVGWFQGKRPIETGDAPEAILNSALNSAENIPTKVLVAVTPLVEVLPEPIPVKVVEHAIPRSVPMPVPVNAIPDSPPPAQAPVVLPPEPPAKPALELKILTRGSKLYGICPHCESTWNIKERMSRPGFKRLAETKGLTCPTCDEAVKLPNSVDVRKLS